MKRINYIYTIATFCLCTMWSLNMTAQGATCATATQICDGASFPANTGSGNDPIAGENASCIPDNADPNASWFWIETEAAGIIDLTVSNSNNLDVDFIAWGPFADPEDGCNMIAVANEVSCDFTLAPGGSIQVTSGGAGEFYLLVVTNFSDLPTNIEMNAGAADEDVVACPCFEVYEYAVEDVCVGEQALFEIQPGCVEATDTDLDLDFYWYAPGGVESEAPAGYDPFATATGGSAGIIGIDDNFPISNTDLINFGGLGGTWNGAICADLLVPLIGNNTCSARTITVFALAWDRGLDTDGDGVSGEYNIVNPRACVSERYDFRIEPDLTVQVVDNGASCGTPTVNLVTPNGTVCSTMAADMCVLDGPELAYDFSNDPAVLAIVDASCAPTDLSGTIACAGCAPTCFYDVCDTDMTTSGIIDAPTGFNTNLAQVYILTDDMGNILQFDVTDAADVNFDITQITGVNPCLLFAVNYDASDATAEDVVLNATTIQEIVAAANSATGCQCISVSDNYCQITKLDSPEPPIAEDACVCQFDVAGIPILTADCSMNCGVDCGTDPCNVPDPTCLDGTFATFTENISANTDVNYDAGSTNQATLAATLAGSYPPCSVVTVDWSADYTISPFGISWTNEVSFEITDPSGGGTGIVGPSLPGSASDADPIMGTVTGSYSTTAGGFAGGLTLEIFDNFDDGGVDGNFAINVAFDLTIQVPNVGGSVGGTPVTTWYDSNGNVVGMGGTFDPATDPNFDVNTAGIVSYFATCACDNGCESTQSQYDIDIAPQPDPPLVPGPFELCQNQNVDEITLTSTSVSGSSTFNIFDASGTTLLTVLTANPTTTWDPDPYVGGAGTFTFIITEEVDNGCVICESAPSTLQYIFEPAPDPTWDAAIVCCSEEPILLSAGCTAVVDASITNTLGIEYGTGPAMMTSCDGVLQDVDVITDAGTVDSGAGVSDEDGDLADLTEVDNQVVSGAYMFNPGPPPPAGPLTITSSPTIPANSYISNFTISYDADGTTVESLGFNEWMIVVSPDGGANFFILDQGDANPGPGTWASSLTVDAAGFGLTSGLTPGTPCPDSAIAGCLATGMTGAGTCAGGFMDYIGDLDDVEIVFAIIDPFFEDNVGGDEGQANLNITITYEYDEYTPCAPCTIDTTPCPQAGGGNAVNWSQTGYFTGDGVFFVEGDPSTPDDDYYYFDPAIGGSGGPGTGTAILTEGEISVEYTVGDAPCELSHLQDFYVFCEEPVISDDVTICCSPSGNYPLTGLIAIDAGTMMADEITSCDLGTGTFDGAGPAIFGSCSPIVCAGTVTGELVTITVEDFETVGGSWGSEVVFIVTDPCGNTTTVIGGPDLGLPAGGFGPADLTFPAGGGCNTAGAYTISLDETFDDPGDDHTFTNINIETSYTCTAVGQGPQPDNAVFTIVGSSAGFDGNIFGNVLNYNPNQDKPAFVTIQYNYGDDLNGDGDFTNDGICAGTGEVTINILDDFTVSLDIPESVCQAGAIDFSDFLVITDSNGDVVDPATVNGMFSIIKYTDLAGTTITDNPNDSGDGDLLMNGVGNIDAGILSPMGVYMPGTGGGTIAVQYQIITENPDGFDCISSDVEVFVVSQPLDFNAQCLCTNDPMQPIVDIGPISGGVAPYTVNITGGGDISGLDPDGDGSYTVANMGDDAGEFILFSGTNAWSVTVIDSRGCETFISGECDIPILDIDGLQTESCASDPTHQIFSNIDVTNTVSLIQEDIDVSAGFQATGGIDPVFGEDGAELQFTVPIPTNLPEGCDPADVTNTLVELDFSYIFNDLTGGQSQFIFWAVSPGLPPTVIGIVGPGPTTVTATLPGAAAAPGTVVEIWVQALAFGQVPGVDYEVILENATIDISYDCIINDDPPAWTVTSLCDMSDVTADFLDLTDPFNPIFNPGGLGNDQGGQFVITMCEQYGLSGGLTPSANPAIDPATGDEIPGIFMEDPCYQAVLASDCFCEFVAWDGFCQAAFDTGVGFFGPVTGCPNTFFDPNNPKTWAEEFQILDKTCEICADEVFKIYPEFDPEFSLDPAEICTTNASFVICPDDIDDILQTFEDLECVFDRPGDVTEADEYIDWSGPGITPLNDGSGCATFDPTAAGAGIHAINLSVGYTTCEASFVANVEVKDPVCAEIEDRSICGSISQNIDLSIMFDGATGGGTFAVVSAVDANGNDALASGEVLLQGGGILTYDENGALDYTIVVSYTVGSAACCDDPSTPAAETCTDAPCDDCYGIDIATLTISGGHSSFLDLPEDDFCSSDMIELYKYSSVEDISLDDLTVDMDGDLEAGEVQFEVVAVNGSYDPADLYVDVNGNGVFDAGIDFDYTAIFDFSGCTGDDLAGTPSTKPYSDACPKLMFEGIPKEVTLTIRMTTLDGFDANGNGELDPTEGCVSLAEDNVWVKPDGNAALMEDAICMGTGMCGGPNSINMSDLFYVDDPIFGTTTSCGYFTVSCPDDPMLGQGADPNDDNGPLGVPDGLFGPEDTSYPCYDYSHLLGTLNPHIATKLYISYTVGDPACTVDTQSTVVELCPQITGFDDPNVMIECTEGQPLNLVNLAFSPFTNQGGMWYGPYDPSMVPADLTAETPVAMPEMFDVLSLPVGIPVVFVYAVDGTGTCIGICPPSISLLTITVLEDLTQPERCHFFGNGEDFGDGAGAVDQIDDGYCSTEVGDPLLLRRICPETIVVGPVAGTPGCDVSTNLVNDFYDVDGDGMTDVYNSIEVELTVATAGTVYPNATINDDWYVQLIYFHQDVATDPGTPVGPGLPGPDLSDTDCALGPIDDPADLDGGDHAGFIFSGTGLTFDMTNVPGADDYVVFNNDCPTDEFSPATSACGDGIPDMVRAGALGMYDPFTAPMSFEDLGVTPTNLCVGATLGDNDYFVLEFSAEDIYAMYDDGDDTNGDGKKDFLAAFFGNNCGGDSKFVWAFGAMTLPEETDLYMHMDGMEIYNYKEDVAAINENYQCGGVCDEPMDLGFTLTWIDQLCEDPNSPVDPTMLPDWLTPEMFMDAITFEVIDGTVPGYNDCYDVFLDINQLVPPACDLTTYEWEICHEIEICELGCEQNNDIIEDVTFTPNQNGGNGVTLGCNGGCLFPLDNNAIGILGHAELPMGIPPVVAPGPYPTTEVCYSWTTDTQIAFGWAALGVNTDPLGTPPSLATGAGYSIDGVPTELFNNSQVLGPFSGMIGGNGVFVPAGSTFCFYVEGGVLDALDLEFDLVALGSLNSIVEEPGDYVYCKTFTTEREHVPNSDVTCESDIDNFLQLGCIDAGKLYFDECKLYNFFEPYTITNDPGFPSDGDTDAGDDIICESFDCDQTAPADPDAALGFWTVPQPFMDYVIQNGTEFAILPGIWEAYEAGELGDGTPYNVDFTPEEFPSFDAFGLDNPNCAYPADENSEKQLIIPVVYKLKACKDCESEKLYRYLHITKTPEVELAISNSPGVCPSETSIICLDEDCEWPNCTFDLILTNLNQIELVAADGVLDNVLAGIPALPNDCDPDACPGMEPALAPGITILEDCGNGTPGIEIDWAVLTQAGGFLDGFGEDLLGNFNLELIVYCGVGECDADGDGVPTSAYCSDSDDQVLFFLGESNADIDDYAACQVDVELTNMFEEGPFATTGGGAFYIYTGDKQDILDADDPANGGNGDGVISGDEVDVTNGFTTNVIAITGDEHTFIADNPSQDYVILYSIGATTSCAAYGCGILTITPSDGDIAAWTFDTDPICTDDGIIDLDELLLPGAVPNGVFTGDGVGFDPGPDGIFGDDPFTAPDESLDDGAHPDYAFDPSGLDFAGEKFIDVTICYAAIEGDGCEAIRCNEIRVYDEATLEFAFANNATTLECQDPNDGNGFIDIFDLSTLLSPDSDQTGVWTIVTVPPAGPNGANAAIFNDQLTGYPGCYELSYTVTCFDGADGACSETQTFDLRLAEQATPAFDLAEEVCWDGVAGSLTLSTLYNGGTFGTNGTIVDLWTVNILSGAGPAPTLSSTTDQEPTVTIEGAGVFEICLTEEVTYPACGPMPAYDVDDCEVTVCHLLNVTDTAGEVTADWDPFGPVCADSPIVDLDALVNGDSDGVFTGDGVSGTHPNYEFDPSAIDFAGQASVDVTICYTVGNDTNNSDGQADGSGGGCDGVECHDVRVYAPVDASLEDLAFACTIAPSGNISLDALFTDVTTPGGSFSGMGVVGNTLQYGEAGCYEITYTIEAFDGATGACMASDVAYILIPEQPQPAFDLPEEICWDGNAGSITLPLVYNGHSDGSFGDVSYCWTNGLPGGVAASPSTTILDFETAGTSDDYAGCGGGFGNVFPQGIVADPTDPTNTVLSMIKVDPSEVWGGVCNTNDLSIDLTVNHELCVDFWEEDATGTLLVKLEDDVPDATTNWEYLFTTTQGWNTYCINTNTPWNGTVAAGHVYERLVIFPDFGTCCTDELYYLDNVVTNQIQGPTFLDKAAMETEMVINSAGEFEICLTETITSEACGSLDPVECTVTTCQTITVTETNVEVVAEWTPVGPLCADSPIVDLDALVTGDTDGVFTGDGVSGTHPDYEFDPAAIDFAGQESVDVSVCYTVGNDTNNSDGQDDGTGAGCDAVECHIITVYAPVNATLDDLVFDCTIAPSGNVSLDALFTDTTTPGGTFSGTGVVGNTLQYDGPGCVEITYTITAYEGATGACTDSDVAYILIPEQPQPSFDIQDQVCFSDGDVASHVYSSLVNSPQYDSDAANVVTTWAITSGPATVDAAGNVTVTGTGAVTVCMTETITTPGCGGLADVVCAETFCNQIEVSDGTAQDASFTIDSQDLCPGETVTLTPTVNGGLFTGPGVVDDGAGTGAIVTVPDNCEDIDVTYTLNDPNGCTSSFTATIFADRIDPTFATSPIEETVECGPNNAAELAAWLAINAGAIADDNCDVAISYALINSISGCAGTSEEVYAFTATDECGNSTTENASFIIEDTTIPEIATIADLTLDCTTISEVADPSLLIEAWLLTNYTASDICGDVTVSHNFNPATLNVCTASTTIVTWTATDECGWTNTATANLIVVPDTEDPIFDFAPADLTLDCGDINETTAITISGWLDSAIASDNCDTDVVLTHDYTETSLDVCVGGSIQVTWTATDACGNATPHEATLTVTADDLAPDLTVPAPIVLDCNTISETSSPAAVIDAWLAEAVAIDVCDTDVVLTHDFDGTLLDVCAGVQTIITVTWTASDACGNNVSDSSTITVDPDTTPPVFDFAPADLMLNCGDINETTAVTISGWLDSAMASDDCDTDVVLTHDYTETSLDVCVGGTIVVTWTATDACENSTEHEATLTVTADDLAPDLTIPAPIVLDCSTISETSSPAAIIDAWLAEASATDLCDTDVVLTHDFDGTSLDVCTGVLTTITVTWTASDACGNNVSDSSTITVDPDTAPPVFDFAPTDLMLNCGDINETTAVTISGWLDSAMASDDCDTDVVLTHDYTETSLDVCVGGTIVVTWTATDACENSTEHEATLTVTADDLAPDLTIPAPIVLDCSTISETSSPAAIIDAWLAEASATDLCDTDVVLTHDFDGTSLDVCTGVLTTITVTWTASDACGNNVSDSSTITVDPDVTPPTFDVAPADLTLDCGDISETSTVTISGWLDSAMASDDCDTDVALTHDYTETSLDVCVGGTVVVTWTAVDACDNTTTHEATLTVTPDTEAPVFTVAPANLTLDCGDINETTAVTMSGWLDSAVAEDLCDTDVTLTHDFTEESLNVCTGSGSPITVTWTAIDACDNIETHSAVLTVTPDTAPPELTVPDPIEISCAGLSATDDPAALVAAFLTTATAMDVCDTDPVLTHDYDGSLIDICVGEVITVNFTATDACGNSTTLPSTITIIPDVTAPDLPMPLNQMGGTDFYTCEGDITFDHPLPSDDCDIVIYTYTVTDPDGTENGPFDILEILSSTPLPRTPGDATITYGFEEGISIVSYYVEDACGNGSTDSFEVGIGDNITPYFADCPPMIMVGNDPDQCSAFVNWDDPIAFDNCDNPDGNGAAQDEITVTQISGPASGTELAVGTYTVVYEAVDDDGNTATCEFDVVVKDTECPEFIATLPGDVTVECDAVPEPFEVQPQWHTADNCTDAEDVVVVFEEVREDGDCPFNYVLKRTWTITDEAGNSCEHNQKVTVEDTTAPELDVPDDTLISSCTVLFDTIFTPIIIPIDTVEELVAIGDDWVITQVVIKKDTFTYEVVPVYVDPLAGFTATATDNCSEDDDITITYSDDVEFLCKGDKAAIVTRTFYAEDECGNISSASTAITILDPNPPVLHVPEKDTISLDADGHIVLTADDLGILAFDACFASSQLEISFKPSTFNCSDIGYHTILVSATDPCNNMTAYEEIELLVIDNIAPTLNCPAGVVNITIDAQNCDNSFGDILDIVQGQDCDVTVTTSPALDAGIDITTSEITVTATDASGNSNSCTIPVNITLVNEVDYSTVLSCNDRVNVSLNGECWLELYPDQILEGNPDLCTELLCIEVQDANGNDHLNFFDESDVGQVFRVRVVDCNGSGNACWGEVSLEEKQTPVVEWPRDTSLLCVEPISPDYHKTGWPTILNCEPVIEMDFEDYIVEYDQCDAIRATIERRWVVRDDEGNELRDTQDIDILPFGNDHVLFPTDITIEDPIDCSLVTETIDDIENGILAPESYLHPDSTGLPSIFGIDLFANNGLCLFSMGYEDEVLEICDGSFEVLRTWSIRDVCSAFADDNPRRHTQVITVYDIDGPEVLDTSYTLYRSIDPWQCTFSGLLPQPEELVQSCGSLTFDAYITGPGAGYIVTDGSLAGGDLEIAAVGVDYGTHWVTYVYTDGCSNVELFKYQLEVIDEVAPVAVCQGDINVTVTVDGVAKIYSTDIDGGSHDAGCGPVSTCIVRMVDFEAGYLGHINGHSAYVATNGCHIDGEFRDTIFDKLGEIEEINTLPFVLCKDELKICCSDLGEQTIVLEATDAQGYTNVCMANITVVDKSSATLVCEPHSIDCTDDKDSDLLPPAGVSSICGDDLPLLYYDEDEFIDGCGSGQIFRVWYLDTNGNGSLDDGEIYCNQVITVSNPTSFDPYSLKWPKHYTGETFSGVNLECNDDDELIEFEADGIAMGDVFTCSATDPGDAPVWCNTSCGLVGVSSEIDTVTAGDACLKLIKRWTVIDWCYWEANGSSPGDDANDTDNDSFEAVEDWAQGVCAGCDENVADPVYFRYTEVDVDGYYTYDQVIKVIDDTDPEVTTADVEVNTTGGASAKGDDTPCSGVGVVTATASDLCGSDAISGELLSWVITYDNGSESTVSLADGPEVAMDTQEGSPGDVHTVTFEVSDGCGNSSSATSTVTFGDEKKPTPICIAGVTTAFMESGSVAIWATDFDLGSFDNCTDIDFAIAHSNEPQDSATASITFSCDDLTQFYELNIWVSDANGNADFCTVGVLIGGTCEDDDENGSGAIIAGSVYTEDGDMIEQTQITIDAPAISEYPNSMVTTASGEYSFANNPVGFDYDISALKDGDYLNGVTTGDLLAMQRHIAAQQLFDSPYKVIAADVNNDQQVSVLDIIVLRNVILGISRRFNNNTSWRFVDEAQVFEDMMAPWPFTEILSHESLQDDKMAEDFIGVKIGDVNSTVQANSLVPAKTRTDEILDLEIANVEFEKDEQVVIPVTSQMFDNIVGFQFTLEHKGLTFESIEAGAINISANNVGVHTDALTVSWESLTSVTSDDVLFNLVFTANNAGALSDKVELNSSITASEIYRGETAEVVNLGLDVTEDVAGLITLNQNDPNPFVDQTTIGFNLPEASEAILSIFNVDGKELKRIEGDFVKGLNEVVVNRSDIDLAGGIVYYQLQVGEFTDTKKMMVVK